MGVIKTTVIQHKYKVDQNSAAVIGWILDIGQNITPPKPAHSRYGKKMTQKIRNFNETTTTKQRNRPIFEKSRKQAQLFATRLILFHNLFKELLFKQKRRNKNLSASEAETLLHSLTRR